MNQAPVMDTPTPTNIKNYLNFPNQHNYQNPGAGNSQNKQRDDRSLQSILGFTSSSHPPSSDSMKTKDLQKVLFDDFDDVPMSSISNMPLPPAPTISSDSSMTMSQSKKNHS